MTGVYGEEPIGVNHLRQYLCMLVALFVLTTTFRVGSGALCSMALPAAASAFRVPVAPWMCHFCGWTTTSPERQPAGFLATQPESVDTTVNEPNTTAASARSLYTTDYHRSDLVRAEGKSADDQPVQLEVASEPPLAADTSAIPGTIDRAHQARSGEVNDQVPQARTGAGTNGWTRISYAIAVLNAGALCAIVLFMLNNPGEASLRIPPRYDPANEHNYSFRIYSNDTLHWCMMSDMQPHQQCASIIQRLGGEARELARLMTPQELMNGGQLNGNAVDPVTLLFHALQTRFGPLEEETRMTAVNNLLNFTRRGNERINELLTRFETTRVRAVNEGNFTMSVEGFTMILFRAVGLNEDQLLQVLNPLGGHFPQTDAQFHQISAYLRRMGHIIENAPGNVAQALRGGQANSTRTFMTNEWQPAQASYAAPATSSSSNSWNPPSPIGYGGYESAYASAIPSWQQAQDANAAYHSQRADDEWDNTSTETESDDFAHNLPDETDTLPENQRGEALYWAYNKTKTNWRRFAQKPTRKVRRFVRKKGGKGKRGKQAFTFMTDEFMDSQGYFKGKGVPMRKSSGKGMRTQRKNPKGADGNIMTCSICGSDEHFRARCPRAGSSSSSAVQVHYASTGGPLDDLLSSVAEPGNIALMVTETAGSSQDRPVEGAHQDHAVSGESVPVPITPPDPWQNTTDPWNTPEAAAVREEQQREQQQRAATATTTSWSSWVQVPSIDQGRPAEVVKATVPIPDPRLVPVAVPGGVPAGLSSSIIQATPLRKPPPPLRADYDRIYPVTSVVSKKAPPPNPNVRDPWTSRYYDTRQEVETARMTARRNFGELVGAVNTALASPPPATGPFRMNMGGTSLFQSPASEPSDAFLEMQQLRLTELSSRRKAPPPPRPRSEDIPWKAPPSVSTIVATEYDGNEFHCSLCLSDFLERESVCRLMCRHCYHWACWDDMVRVRNLDALCPNCRAPAHVIALWHFIGLRPDPSQGQPNLITATTVHHNIATPLQSETEDAPSAPQPPHPEAYETAPSETIQSENFQSEEATDDAEMYPTWPSTESDARQWGQTPSLQMETDNATPGVTASAPTSACYMSSTELSDGRQALLIDPGSWGNLSGSTWSRRTAHLAMQGKAGMPKQQRRDRPLNVSGVGNGSQTCTHDCTLPISLVDLDGEPLRGTFTTPTVNDSSLPALLGLNTLIDRRAILDMTTMRLHFTGPGETTLNLSPGSRTFQCHQAPSGHMMLPCCNYEVAAPARARHDNSSQLSLAVDTAEPQANPQEKSEEPSPRPTGRGEKTS